MSTNTRSWTFVRSNSSPPPTKSNARRLPVSEVTSVERLQPSLLDRLTDDDPGNQKEARDRSTISALRLRDIVVRDLGHLMNTGNLATVEDLTAWPDVEHSVVNYGIADLSGL